MLTASKSIWFEKLFGIYNRNLLKRKFHSFRIQNLEALKTSGEKTPLVIYANHSSWWDGLILFDILKSENIELFVLMEEKNLKKFLFFRKLGAFSIVRESPKLAFKSLNYAAEVLSAEKNRTLLIFPQGEIAPNDKRPLEFFHGLSFLIEKLQNCSTLPCAIRMEFLGNFKPEIFVKFGAPEIHRNVLKNDRKQLTAKLQSVLTQNLDSLKSDIIKENYDDFRQIF